MTTGFPERESSPSPKEKDDSPGIAVHTTMLRVNSSIARIFSWALLFASIAWILWAIVALIDRLSS